LPAIPNSSDVNGVLFFQIGGGKDTRHLASERSARTAVDDCSSGCAVRDGREWQKELVRFMLYCLEYHQEGVEIYIIVRMNLDSPLSRFATP